MERKLRDEAEKFLNHEANLLDERKYEDWSSLFSEEGIYWVPIEDGSHPDETVSIIYDESIRRQERVYRLVHTQAPAQSPPSRTQHFISNIEVEAKSEEEMIIRSSQLVYEMREGDHRQTGVGEQRSFAGKFTHHISFREGHWKILSKKVVLLNRNLPISNLSFIL